MFNSRGSSASKKTMKLQSVLLLALTLLLASCSSQYLLDPGVVYECHAEQFRGYVVSEGSAGVISTNMGNLYVDEGQLVSEPKRVSFTKRGSEISVEGRGISKQSCYLTPYFTPQSKVFPQGPDYQTPTFEVQRRNNVVYAHAEGYWSSYPHTKESFAKTYANKLLSVRMTNLSLDMDIFEPVGDGEQLRPLRPLLVMVHGGAFFNGDKADEEYSRWCELFAASGYVAVSVNYRLGYGMLPSSANVERAGYRAVQDVNAAIRYMLAHKDRFSIDPNRIYLAGCSAGAIASLNVAFMTEKDRPASVGKDMGGLTAVAPEYTDRFKIRALCNMWGAMANLDLLKNSRTSILSIHSKYDPIVPYGVGYPFADMLKSAADLVMPQMYGSSEIHNRAQKLSKRSVLIPYSLNKHTVVRKESDDSVDEEILRDMFGQMTRFFFDDMVPHPVKIAQKGSTEQHFGLSDPVDVADYDWQVEGGVIIDRTDNRGVNVLFFSDAPVKKITLSGQYRVGINFNDSMSF